MNIFEIEVHPFADSFPLIPADELEQLADSIVRNGLRDPIMIDTSNGEPVLIDGRNRLAACKLAGIESDEINYIEFSGDIDEYIIDRNLRHRHMSKGQQAMVIAMRYPSGQWKKKLTLNVSLSSTAVATARLIVKHLPSKAEQVLSGSLPLNEAYDMAKKERDATEGKKAMMLKLQDEAPDLAELVKTGTLSMKVALIQKSEREEKDRMRRYANTCTFRSLADASDIFLSEKNMNAMIDVIRNPDEYQKFQKADIAADIARLDIIKEKFEVFYQSIKEAAK